MRKLVIFFILLFTYNISSAQTGWGYVNYTSYKTHAGNGSTSQYGQFPFTKAEFDNMLNTANTNTTITHTGETQFVNVYNGSTSVPHWSGDYYAIKFEFYFFPKETGTYTFSITSDDASDLLVNGNMIVYDYGGHGAGNWKNGQIQMVAGTRYTIVARYQEYGGGDAFYVRWAKPSTPNTFSYYNDEVTNIGTTPSKQAKINFDFGGVLDKTKFTASKPIGSNGWVDVTNAIDSTKISNGVKATIDVSNWESIIINPYDANLGGHRLQIDERVFSGVNLNDIKSIKLIDIYDGSVTPLDFGGWWKQWVIPGDITNKITSSSYQSYLRLQNGWYALMAGSNIAYTPTSAYKPQSVTITTTNNLTTLYNSIITVSDVWLAFKEVANIGIFGNQSGNEFTYGIQYKNGDVNDDGVFNETDTYLLLQHLTGKKQLVDVFNLQNTLKLIPTSTYNTIGKSNWSTFPSYLGNTYNFDINTGNAVDTFYLSGTWKGDVNLSHSATPLSNGVTTMSVRTLSTKSTNSNEIVSSIMSEVVNDKVEISISLDPLEQELVGVQFQLNYDKSILKFEGINFTTKGNPNNFGKDMGDYINLGSLVTDGGMLDKTTEYKMTFSILNGTKDILGLTSISTTDAVSKNGNQLKVKLN